MHILLLFSLRLVFSGIVELEPHGPCSILFNQDNYLGLDWSSHYVDTTFIDLAGVLLFFS